MDPLSTLSLSPDTPLPVDPVMTLEESPVAAFEQGEPVMTGALASVHQSRSGQLDPQPVTSWGELDSADPASVTNAGGMLALTAAELAAAELPEPKFAVQGLMPTGLTVLAGSPKVGKSFLALDLAYSVAAGEPFLGFDTAPGAVLFIAFEDSMRRLQLRYLSRHGDNPSHPPITFASPPMLSITQLPTVIAAWVDAHPDASLVIVDTYGRVTSEKRGNENDYNYVTRTLGALQRLALERQLCIVLIHHNRKAKPDDADQYDKVHGSMAITGVADTTITIERERNQPLAVLNVTGRDVGERAFTFQLNIDTGRATASARSQLLGMTPDQVDILRRIHGGARTPKDLATASGKSPTSVQNILARLGRDGRVTKSKHGVYELPPAIAAEFGDPDDEEGA